MERICLCFYFLTRYVTSKQEEWMWKCVLTLKCCASLRVRTEQVKYRGPACPLLHSHTNWSCALNLWSSYSGCKMHVTISPWSETRHHVRKIMPRMGNVLWAEESVRQQHDNGEAGGDGATGLLPFRPAGGKVTLHTVLRACGPLTQSCCAGCSGTTCWKEEEVEAFLLRHRTAWGTWLRIQRKTGPVGGASPAGFGKPTK